MFIDGREQLMEAGGGARTYHLPEGDVECVYTIHSEPATLPRSYADRGIRNVEWRLGLPPAHTLPLRAFVAERPGVDRRRSSDRRPRRARRATCWSPCSPARAARPRIPVRSSACAPTSSERAPASASRSTPISRSRSAPSGEPTPARTPRACRPSVTAQLLASGQALRTGVGGPEVIVPVEAFFAALATRGMHAEIAVRRPLG